MSRTSVTPVLGRAILPLYAGPTSRLRQVAAVLVGTGLLTASSWIVVPMVPVPMTMQTLAVTLIGAWYGWRLAGVTLALWLLEATAGMPVLAGGHAGLAYMVGPTGGYLVSFVLVAIAVGWLAECGVLRRSLGHAAGVMLLANLAILAIGAAWLAHFVGPDAAMATGVVPFLAGGVLKAALAAGLVEVVGARRRKAKLPS